MFADLRERVKELGTVLASNEKIIAEYVLMLGEERSWKEWQSKFPDMLPGDEPLQLNGVDLDFSMGEYQLRGRVERERSLKGVWQWQLVAACVEEG